MNQNKIPYEKSSCGRLKTITPSILNYVFKKKSMYVYMVAIANFE